MVKLQDINDISVRKLGNSVYELSTMFGGYFRHRQYIGYTKTQAIKLFKKAIEKGEI